MRANTVQLYITFWIPVVIVTPCVLSFVSVESSSLANRSRGTPAAPVRTAKTARRMANGRADDDDPTRPNELNSLLPSQTCLDGTAGKNLPPSTGQRILDLAVPAAAALLIDPLMTLVDTAFVGRFAVGGAEELAGMGSAAALLTFSFYLFNFLCTATTPLIAASRSAGNEDRAVTLGGQALSLALTLGCVLTITLLTFRQPLLTLMGTGLTGANDYALAFLSVRALAAPAVMSIEASTGVLRGYLDTKTPIAVLIAANTINLLFDVILIAYLGLGPLGAAIATTTAEWISAALFLLVLAGKIPSPTGERRPVPILPVRSVPSFEDLKPLLVASSAIFFRSLTLQISLSTAAALAARGAAPSVAAHQTGIQLWLLCSFFCDSLAAASQGLIADALGRKDDQAVLDITKTIFQYSLVLGFGLAGLLLTGSTTGFIFHLFTNDDATIHNMKSILPLIIAAQPLNALVFAADGVLQGASEFPFQAKAMALSGLTAVGTYLVLEATGYETGALVNVWSALIALQGMRGVTSFWKLADPNGPIKLFSQDKR
jgi:putative MATE family efflux protein